MHNKQLKYFSIFRGGLALEMLPRESPSRRREGRSVISSIIGNNEDGGEGSSATR